MRSLFKTSPQDRLIDYGTKASTSVLERIRTAFLLLIILALSAYSGWLTMDKLTGISYDAGLERGYKIGYKSGYRDGNENACMIKAI